MFNVNQYIIYIVSYHKLLFSYPHYDVPHIPRILAKIHTDL